MNKMILPLVLVAVATLAIAGTHLGAAKDPEMSTLTGTVIDVASFAAKGTAATPEEGGFHAENGFPVAILEDATKEVFIATYRNPAPASALETANRVLAPLMGRQVVARGQIYREHGINVIQLAVVSEM